MIRLTSIRTFDGHSMELRLNGEEGLCFETPEREYRVSEKFGKMLLADLANNAQSNSPMCFDVKDVSDESTHTMSIDIYRGECTLSVGDTYIGVVTLDNILKFRAASFNDNTRTTTTINSQTDEMRYEFADDMSDENLSVNVVTNDRNVQWFLLGDRYCGNESYEAFASLKQQAETEGTLTNRSGAVMHLSDEARAQFLAWMGESGGSGLLGVWERRTHVPSKNKVLSDSADGNYLAIDSCGNIHFKITSHLESMTLDRELLQARLNRAEHEIYVKRWDIEDSTSRIEPLGFRTVGGRTTFTTTTGKQLCLNTEVIERILDAPLPTPWSSTEIDHEGDMRCHWQTPEGNQPHIHYHEKGVGGGSTTVLTLLVGNNSRTLSQSDITRLHTALKTTQDGMPAVFDELDIGLRDVDRKALVTWTEGIITRMNAQAHAHSFER